MRQHYNAASRETGRQRQRSRHLQLRKGHNQLKLGLMREWVPRPPRSVLDLACGKGGDVSKWSTLRAGSYVGVDVADEALRVAQQRYAHLHMPQQYVTGDVLDGLPGGHYEVVSLQFAMHYFGGERLPALWRNIRSVLAPGGLVLCTYTDGMAVARLTLSELHRQQWTSGTLHIRLALAELEVPERSWRALQAGAQDGAAVPDDLVYRFHMGNMVSRHCPEYFLWPASVHEAVYSQAGLVVVASQNFAELPLQTGDQEWTVSRLYRTLVVKCRQQS